MKKPNSLVVVGVLLLIPLLFGYLITPLLPKVKRNLTDVQMEEVCKKIKFEIAPIERVYIQYSQGYMQASTNLTVYVGNVESETEFLSRFQGNVIERESDYYEDNAISTYDVEIFHLTSTPKDYNCHLSFFHDGEKLNAMFYINGYIKELKSVYGFQYITYQHYLNNWMFMIPLVMELVIMILLLGQKYLRKRLD